MQRRLTAFVFPVLIIVPAALTTPTFIEAGLAWWPLFIFGLPMVLAILICVEYWNASIQIDGNMLRYQSVGYQLDATWRQVSVTNKNGKVTLRVSEAEPRLHLWLAPMQRILMLFIPRRALFAQGLMASIPLWYFSTASDDAVMAEFYHHSNNGVDAGSISSD
ncbi:hypothetical protein FPY71_01520 [Aureimonas fodinaquatilis]|uniref:Uncharacterized protein n=1 Tax=Aureimonas fodinaquatilis TaxID=2565783 RepID=A0A5B0DYD4_9HYPH|nr:hypothetical protein [Aureimonas fodinaquatilis]KAA0971837.1 hypothetical protein FPY71_01520 [Aureimonas fodinaquatilis]